MILHAIHADKTFGESGIKGRIIVKSPDTDVLIICIHYFPSMQPIRQEILSMLVCWQRQQETFSNQESVGLL
jgi:hypothetical protein